ARARQAQPRERRAAGAQTVALRRQAAGKAQFVFFLANARAATGGAIEIEAPALTVADDATACLTRQAGTVGGGQRKAPPPCPVGHDAHRITANIMATFEHTDQIGRLG